MKPKVPAAIITGTMASPSRPSVMLTAFPAPTITKPPNTTKNQPMSKMSSFEKGSASLFESAGVEM